MRFEEIQALIPQYLAGQLTPADRQMFEAEMDRNIELTIEVEELRSIWQELGTLCEQQPSASLRAKFYQRLNAVSKEGNGRARSLFRWWKPRFALQAAAALAIFASGAYVGRINLRGANSQTQVAALQNQVEGLQRTVALSLLERQTAGTRLQGIDWSSRVGRPDQELLSVLLTTLNHDANVNVRLASLDALEKFAGDATVRKSLEQSILQQPSPLVQIALIDALVHLQDHGAAGEFKKISSDMDLNAAVRQQAQWGLQKLTYQ